MCLPVPSDRPVASPIIAPINSPESEPNRAISPQSTVRRMSSLMNGSFTNHASTPPTAPNTIM
jgi:hypothetical protein